MINKFLELIHNRFLKYFKHFFFMRYIFGIFLIAFILFISIPKFLNFEKKRLILNDFLMKKYEIKIDRYKNISFKIFPLPHLSIQGAKIKAGNNLSILNTQDLKIYVNPIHIYNFQNFKSKKISLNNSQGFFKSTELKYLNQYFKKLNSNIKFENLDIVFKNNNETILKIQNIFYSNYGVKKDKIRGEVFDRRFNININRSQKSLALNLLDTGIKAKFNFDIANNVELLSGSSKISILDNYLKFNFKVHEDKIELLKSSLRNKDLLIFFDSFIFLKPFFEINSNVNIDKIDQKFLEKVKLDNILEYKNILKKLNSRNKLVSDKKIFKTSIIEKFSLQSNLANGRMTLVSEMAIAGGEVLCNGDSLLTDDFPRFTFDCNFRIFDSKLFSKKMSLPKKIYDKPFDLSVLGSLNLVNRKINFKEISIDNKMIISKENKIIYKMVFEKLLLRDGFPNMFKKDNIKEFLIEII